MTLLTALALTLASVGATYALGLGSVFSDAEVEVSIVEQSKDGVVLSVHGTDYSAKDPGIEIALNPVGYRGSGTRSTFIKSVVINPENPDDWTYTFTLDAAQVARLDPGTDYQIMTMRGGDRDLYDSSDSRAVGVPFDFDALSQPSSSPTPEEPSGDTGSSDGSGSGSGSGSGAGDGTSSGRPATGDSGDGTGAGSDEKPRKRASKKPWTAPEEPPTVKGITLTGLDDVSVDADDVIHAQASGFRPHETGIRVVVYSTPLVLSTSVKANGSGVAKWSGRLPKDIGLGKHTLTFQGSVNRGIRFLVTGTPSDGECVQSGCAPPTGAVKKAAAADESGVGPLTWIIVATMILLALVAGAVAMLSGRRKRDPEWDEPGYAQAPPRYPADPRHASGPHPAYPRQPQLQPQHLGQHQGPPRHETPLPRRLPADQLPSPRQSGPRQSGPRQPGPRQPDPRQPDPRQPVPRQPSHRQAAPQHRDPQHAAPVQPAHPQPRPPESFAPPSQRDQAYQGQRVAGR
ncbi:hypothetical protein [Nocardioides luteus]|uniref:Bacterial Ig-like domain-containing protein n=1 Tax=Nocardioides luteus TaxID=1844 RepID=A0A1J4N6K6_9ACTN|nr:hypothetical protein [Nocardioides luteus]OIJ26137.1 hypothetical protein UG56_014025 [Nocardioides luteus]